MSLPAHKYPNKYIYGVNCLLVVCLQSLTKVFPLFYKIDSCIRVIFLKKMSSYSFFFFWEGKINIFNFKKEYKIWNIEHLKFLFIIVKQISTYNL